MKQAEEKQGWVMEPIGPEMVPGCTEIAKTAPDPWRRKDFEKLPDAQGHPCFVALEEGEPIGFACFLALCDTADLQLVAVKPAHRGRGLGKSLLQHGFEQLRQQGITRVLLEVRCGNTAALALYESLGFHMLAHRGGMYRNPPEDGLLMAKTLGEPTALKQIKRDGKASMKILGIESSCDETAAAVVEDGRQVLSSVVASSVAEQALYGGVVPEIASRRHIECISTVAERALAEAGISMAEIAAVAVTYAPGLIGAVLVGVNFAKGLAYSAGKPLAPVHHLRGHVASLYLSHPGLAPPFLCLIASGGHCHLVQVNGYTGFTVLGRTVDDAAGEAFDKVARTLGLGYPGGPAVAKAALPGDVNAYPLPTPHAEGLYDVSFSGLKTAVLNLVNKAGMKGEALNVPGLAASFQNKVTDILTDRLRRAATDTNASAIAIAGGVAANEQLREKVAQAAEELGLVCYLPEVALCGDNAAMIAAQGYYEWRAGCLAGADLNGYASWPIEENYKSKTAAL